MPELLVREHCHLCSEALELLAEFGCTPHLLDIDEQLELAADYGLRIPVLRLAGAELDWPFDGAAVQRFLAGVQP